MPDPTMLRSRLIAGEHLVGTFVKTPTTHATEILGALGFDFVVIDEEHAPFDRLATDAALLAARAAGTAALVRVQSAAGILSVLDCGATGVLMPHVATEARAREVAAACRYRGGRRGYSGSPRHAGYGAAGMWKTVEAADAAVTVIAQIEDPEALDEIDAIAAVAGIDALFVGRGDLAVALGAKSSDAPDVRGAVERIAQAARSAGKPVCVFVAGEAEASWLRDQGATAFVVAPSARPR
jgi:2-keto-3-deoxy-L-rhamnonate aldolase RhmA